MKKTLLLLIALTSTLVLKAEEHTYIEFKTNKGSFTIKLYNDTPHHRDNIIKLVKEGAYNNVLFHRVIRGFMCQLGGEIKDNSETAQEQFKEKYNYTLPAEILYPKHFHKRGAVGAARLGNEVNPNKESDGIQFYIVTGEYFLESDLRKYETPERGGELPPHVKESYKLEGGAPHLDGEYTIFGEVVKGMKSIERIEQVNTDSNDRPTSPIYIRSARITTAP